MPKTEIKSRPILFSGPMISAILAGRKTQTRRIMKPICNLPADNYYSAHFHDDYGGYFRWTFANKHQPSTVPCVFPYGKVGDILWIRETIWQWGRWVANGTTKTGRPKRKFLAVGQHVRYVADCPDYPKDAPELGRIVHADELWIKRPAIFMPRWASRLSLEITNIRVERLNEISDTDILAEGVTKDLFESLVESGAKKENPLPEHWVNGGDEGLSYCRRCCIKEIARLKKEKGKADEDICLDGGWATEGDRIAYCETCGKLLDNILTGEGGDSELEHFIEHGINLSSSNDCYSALCASQALSWEPIEGFSDRYSKERSELLHRVAWRTLWESINGPDSWGSQWVWVVSFKVVQS